MGASIKLGTIDHHSVVSIIRVFMTSYQKIIFLEFALIDREQSLSAQTKTIFQLTTFQKLSYVWGLKRRHN